MMVMMRTPITHTHYVGWFHTSPQYYYLLYAFAFEIVAVFFYASMVPERVTNIFDVALNSHSIWHCLNMGFDYYIVVMVLTSWEQLEKNHFCESHMAGDADAGGMAFFRKMMHSR